MTKLNWSLALLLLALGGLTACPTSTPGDDDDAGDDDDSGDDDDATGDDDDATGDDDDATGDDDDATGDDDDATGDDDDATGDDDDATGDDDDSAGDDDDATGDDDDATGDDDDSAGDDDDATGDDDDSTTSGPVPPSSGDLAIVEVMAKPEGPDTQNEWFELVNVSGGEIELDGVQITFADAVVTHTISGSWILADGDRAVLGNSTNTANNGGAPVDYAYGTTQMEEDLDTLTLTSASGVIVDEVSWNDDGGVGSWPVIDGWSMVFDHSSIGPNAASDNDVASNWCQEAIYTQYAPSNADLNFGTPGAPSTVDCLLPPSGNSDGDVLINEYMQNPMTPVLDNDGEWIELYNNTGAAIDLFGWTIQDSGWDEIRIVTTLVLPASGYVVLGRTDDQTLIGTLTVNYAYREELSLSNAADEIILLDPAGTQIDIVEYDEATGWPDPTGFSTALDPPAQNGQNNDPTVWCQHALSDGMGNSADYDGNGNIGTPGAQNNCAQ